MKAVLIYGVSASGKSTLAEKYLEQNNNMVHVERDKIRFEILDLGNWKTYKINPATELIVDTYWKALIYMASGSGYDVLISDTLCKASERSNVRKMLGHFGYDVEEITPIVTLEECIERDKLRGGFSVGEQVILRQWANLHGEKK